MESYSDLKVIKEEEEESFMMTSLLTAAEEGNLLAIEELLENSSSLDLNVTNKHGETAMHHAAGGGHLDILQYLHDHRAKIDLWDKHGNDAVYWAARHGHVSALAFFKDQGASLNQQNKDGESPIHVATRYSHVDVIEYLCPSGADINLQDKQGETALHTAAWHGLPSQICQALCSAGCRLDIKNKEEETPLHCAAARGNLECLRILLAHGAPIDAVNRRGCTALHLACRRRHVALAMLLLQAGAHFDVVDQQGETALHPAAREGLLPVVQTVCALGCTVNLNNKSGLSPLHIAAKAGHTEVVRCLLLSGVNVDLQNKDGVTAEIIAIAQGHNEAAELLGRLKPEKHGTYIKQLMPTTVHLRRIKLKVFGNSAVGKTTLIDSLKCGYFSSLLRKAGIGASSSSVSSAPSKAGVKENGVKHPSIGLETQLSFESAHDDYTHGIDIQQTNIPEAGDMSVWEFSGYQPYYMLYDRFIGDYNCVHVVLFRLSDTFDVQLSQLEFWLSFLKARIQPLEPIGYAGRLPFPAKVILVATHSDKLNTSRTSNSNGNSCETSENADVTNLLVTVTKKFYADLNIYPQIFHLDAHVAMSSEIKALRNAIAAMKGEICESLPPGNGFLEATVAALPQWCKVLATYPVVTWPSFIEYIRSTVNILASEEHFKEVMCQLQLMGEVVYIETDADDLVVLSPRWLCSTTFGAMLALETTTHIRPTGCFSTEDFQLQFPECDAEDLLALLEALQVSTRCDIDGEVEYELPCLNFVETLSGLWDREDLRLSDGLYGGMRLAAPPSMKNQLMHIFPRIQVQLRRDFLIEQKNPENDLYQWYHGSKYCRGSLEALITLDGKEQAVDVKCRGPSECVADLYQFLEGIHDVISSVVEESLPGLCLERHPLSAVQLIEHRETIEAYSPKSVLCALMRDEVSVSLNDGGRAIVEEFVDLVAFGSDEIFSNLKSGLDLHVSNLSVTSRRLLSSVLDPADPTGRDWCLLALSLGLTEELPYVDTVKPDLMVSKTDHSLALWAQNPSSTVRILIAKLMELGREDAVDAILCSVPVFRLASAAECVTSRNSGSHDERGEVNQNGHNSSEER